MQVSIWCLSHPHQLTHELQAEHVTSVKAPPFLWSESASRSRIVWLSCVAKACRFAQPRNLCDQLHQLAADQLDAFDQGTNSLPPDCSCKV